MNTTATTSAATTVNTEILAHRVKTLRANYTRHAKWMNSCHDYSRNGGPVPTGRPPGKPAKYRGYDDARSVASMLNIEVPAELRGTLHEWRFVLAAAGAERLATLPASVPTH